MAELEPPIFNTCVLGVDVDADWPRLKVIESTGAARMATGRGFSATGRATTGWSPPAMRS
jgi:hypothetical protein